MRAIAMNSRCLASIAVAMTLAAFPRVALTQDYPSKPIRIVVPYPAGGGVDIVARLVAAHLPARLKQPVIVENRSGAFGNIAGEYVAKATPDGYTLLQNTVAQAITPSTYTRLPFDPVNDFAPVTQLSRTPLVLVVPPKLPVQNVKELIVLARAQPGKLNYGSTGVTNPLHLAMELLKLSTGTDIVAIPYSGDGPMMTAVLSGDVHMAVVSLVTAAAHLKAGRLRALGVTTPQRASAMPDLPAVSETVPGFQMTSWQALFAPAKTPREVISRIQRETAAVLQLPQVREKFQGFGGEPVGNTPEEFDALFKADVATFAKIVKAAKIPAQD